MKNLFGKENFSIFAFCISAIVAVVAVFGGEKSLAIYGIASMLFWAIDVLNWEREGKHRFENGEG